MGSSGGAGQREVQPKPVAPLVDRVPAALLGRVQTSFNTSSVSSQQKVLPRERPRYPADAIGGSAWVHSQSFCPKGPPVGDDLQVQTLLVSQMWQTPTDGAGVEVWLWPIGKRMFLWQPKPTHGGSLKCHGFSKSIWFCCGPLTGAWAF